MLEKFRGASLFDLDQTLLTENSSYRFGSYLYKHKCFPLSSMLYFVGCYSLHKVGKLSLHDLHEKIFQTLFKGRSLAHFQKLSTDFINESFDSMIYEPALKRLHEAKRMGHFTAILSSSPSFLVKHFAERFGVNEWAGTNYSLDNEQKLSGIIEVLDGAGKARYLNDLSERYQIPKAEISAYSDSFLDMPLLEAAGTAIGVNPDNKLRAMCEKYQWDII